MPFVEGSVAEVVATLSRRVRGGRGFVALGVVAASEVAAFRTAAEPAVRSVVGPGADLLLVLWEESDAVRAGLRDLNRERDILLRTGAVVVLVAPDEHGLLLLKKEAFDLLSAPDLEFRVLRQDTARAWEEVAGDLRRLALERSCQVDLTGLVPQDAATLRVDVEDLYIDIVRLPEPDPLAPAARRNAVHRVLLVGPPGAGKSIWLKHLTALYADGTKQARDPLGIGRRVPILLALAELAHERATRTVHPSLDRFLVEWISRQGVTGASGIWKHAGGILLLLDGLDEVRGTGERMAILDLVHRLLTAHPGLAVVVTSRPFVLDEIRAEQRRPFRILRCAPLQTSRIAFFLRRFFRIRGRARPVEDAREVQRRVELDPDLAVLAQTPLLLVLLALLFDLEGRIPERRSMIYHRVTEILADRWEKARTRATGHSLATRAAPLGETLRVLGAVAWWFLDTRKGEATSEELRAELVRVELERGESTLDAEARADGMMEQVHRRSALLTATVTGQWHFVHRTLAEYLAGVDLCRGGPRFEGVLADPFRPDWHETVAFCAAELGRRADDERLGLLGEALLRDSRRGGRYGGRHATLLGAVLQEDPGWSPSLQRRIVQRFVTLATGRTFSPLSQPAVEQVFLDVARRSRDRTWGPDLRAALRTLLEERPWIQAGQSQGLAVVRVMGPALQACGIDPEPLVADLLASGDRHLVSAGWENRWCLAREEQRAVLLEAWKQALPDDLHWADPGQVRDLEDLT